MNTKQIDYCIELAHTLNFSRAADNLFVSQPTFSYQIRLLEEEIGFTLFERSGKGVSLTPAGSQFVAFLAGMREDLKRAIEQGQNFSSKYKDIITISLMVRQALFFLPEAMRLFEASDPETQITPVFQYQNGVESFLRNETDILFALKEQTHQIPGISVHDLFESRIRLIATGNIRYFNSPDHDTTLTNVAAGKGICLAPGFLNDHSGQFAWIPFDCGESFSCVLCTHKTDSRPALSSFISILKKLYQDAVAFPL